MDITIFAQKIDLFAILASTIATMVIGALWYSPVLFAKPWMESVGKKMEDLKDSANIGYLISFIGLFVFSFVLAYLLKATRANTLLSAVRIGLMIWAGFILTVTVINTAFSGRSYKLAAIDAGYFLVNAVVASLILGYWK